MSKPPEIFRSGNIHEQHHMHDNSLQTYEEEAGNFEDRAAMILGFLRIQKSPCSDRFIMHSLGFTDMNAVRPRITEMIDDGVLAEAGTIQDPETGKPTRLVKIRPQEEPILKRTPKMKNRKLVLAAYDYFSSKYIETEEESYFSAFQALGWVLGKNNLPK